MTHRRTLLIALACTALFAAGYSVLAPDLPRGWGSVEIVDISVRERDDHQGIEISTTMRLSGARFGVAHRFAIAVTSARCEFNVGTLTSKRRVFGPGDRVERQILSPVCAADDYELTVVLLGELGLKEIARDTMRFSVP